MNVYEVITKRIIEQLENGVIPWKRPWRSALAQNLVSKKEYRGINSILLNSLPFENPYFLTFKQARLLGGHIRAGAKGFPVIFWQFIEDTSTEERKRIPFLRYYTVFNVLQTSGIEVPSVQALKFNPIDEAEKILSDMPHPPTIEYGAKHASYSPKTDTVKIPARESFDTPQDFYSTLYHELSHASGSLLRLNRQGITEDLAFGSTSYSKEELVAEISASFLCAKAGIIGHTILTSASYIYGWLNALKNDKRMIIAAAAQAQKASDYILGIDSRTVQE
jgi:antirestriction protein ArdC